MLVDAVSINKGNLFGKFGNTITASSKTFIWDKIAEKVNTENDTVTRTGEEVTRKRTDWSSATKTQNAKRKVTRQMTGWEATDLDLKVLAIIGKDATNGFSSAARSRQLMELRNKFQSSCLAALTFSRHRLNWHL